MGCGGNPEGACGADKGTVKDPPVLQSPSGGNVFLCETQKNGHTFLWFLCEC